MSKYKLKTSKIEKKVVDTYKKIENGAVAGYQAVEDAVVGSYQKIEKEFIEKFLDKNDTTSKE
jgi:hypothetical protein